MTITRDEVAGYAVRDLATDLGRWFADREPADLSGGDVRPVAPFLDRLPPESAAALTAFDALVRSGRFPNVLDVADWSYGFDFAANGCGIVDADYETTVTDDEVYSIGADGGGNLYVVLTDGRVAVWFHEEEVLEGDTRFDDLDMFLWSIVRFAAVRAGRLSRADVEADFRALGQDGALHPELGLLARLSHGE
ncbi:hypothetical protein [Actinoplanes rectilineatus]|uniref:hypothetical protein n=1 Tax=Actinoplanes rectilineatus TaxID=113571 RepID=UPI0005F2AAC2|nr:hypothetical protein [Actinoplanes rectilineatus]